MSYDLMVFEITKAPKTRTAFMNWFHGQTQWNEEHDYQSIAVASPSLKNWFMKMIEVFPPMNGPLSPDEASFDGHEDLEHHLTDYAIGRDIIYAAFSWSLVDEAYTLVTQLAKTYDVGFFDVSADDGAIIFPDGTTLR